MFVDYIDEVVLNGCFIFTCNPLYVFLRWMTVITYLADNDASYMRMNKRMFMAVVINMEYIKNVPVFIHVHTIISHPDFF
jgi:hypothetical protein